MSDKTKIEWSDATWNPVTGCSKVSEGCRNCYAMKFAERWRGTTGHYFENGFDITLRPDKLDQPIMWKRPRLIFVNSMSDLFHQDIPDDFIEQVFATMALSPQHTFQVLTKRPSRMLKFFQTCVYNGHKPGNNPLPNVWLGVSVENQKAADERIPLLLETPAAGRFLSCEPLLGLVDLRQYLWPSGDENLEHTWPNTDRIGWVIAGGESGPGARPMHPDWARGLRDQCQAAGVPFFFKQHGEWTNPNAGPISVNQIMGKRAHQFDDGITLWKIGKQNAGRLLDGRTWDEFPGEVPAACSERA